MPTFIHRRARLFFGIALSVTHLCGCGMVASRSLGGSYAPLQLGCISNSGSPIQITASYQLSFQSRIVDQQTKANNAQIEKFISIGIQQFSRDYTVSTSDWVVKSGTCGTETVKAEADSPWSSSVSSADQLSGPILNMVKIDQNFQRGSRLNQFRYKWRFHAVVLASRSFGDDKTLDITSVIRADLFRKNAYSDGDYAPVNNISPEAVTAFEQYVSQSLFQTYVAAMRAEGIKVNVGRDTPAQGPDVR